jgi:mevalonate pyrophosphate decarboxylase
VLLWAKRCFDPGSNQGPSDLQSDALPTELSKRPQVLHTIQFRKLTNFTHIYPQRYTHKTKQQTHKHNLLHTNYQTHIYMQTETHSTQRYAYSNTTSYLASTSLYLMQNQNAKHCPDNQIQTFTLDTSSYPASMSEKNKSNETE